MTSEVLRFVATVPARFAAGPVRERRQFEAVAFVLHDFPADPYGTGVCQVFAIMCTQPDCPRFCLRVRVDATEKHRTGFGVWYLEHRAIGMGWDELARGDGEIEASRALALGISIVCAIPELRRELEPLERLLPEG